MTAFARHPDEHLTEEELLLYFMEENLLHPRRREAMYQHIISCPGCMVRTAEPLEQMFQVSDEGKILSRPGHQRQAAAQVWRSGLRLAASPRTVEPTPAELAQMRPAPYLTVAGVDLLRAPGEETVFMVSRSGLAHKRVTLRARSGEVLSLDVDPFGRFELSAEQQALLEGLVEAGVQVEMRVE